MVSHVTSGPRPHEVTHKKMDTKATVRFSKGDVSVTPYSDLQTPGHTSSKYKDIHQVPRTDVKTIHRFLVCRVLRAQGRCSARCSVTHREAPGAGAGGGPGWGTCQTVRSFTRLTLSWVWLWCRVGHVLTLSQPLGYSSEVETAHRELSKIRGGEDSHGELNFEMLLTQKLVVIT